MHDKFNEFFVSLMRQTYLKTPKHQGLIKNSKYNKFPKIVIIQEGTAPILL